MRRLVFTVVALLLTTAGAYAQRAPTWLQDHLIRQGRFQSVTINLTAHCPSGEQFRLTTNDPVYGLVTVAMVAGATSRGDYLEWVGRYMPDELPKVTERVNECFLGKPRDA